MVVGSTANPVRIPLTPGDSPVVEYKGTVAASNDVTPGGNWFTKMSTMNKAVLIIAVGIGGYFALKHFKVVK